jgi:NAD(P)-dependent dehydrogenase (short-subunit alcohol dehydrogenase family)
MNSIDDQSADRSGDHVPGSSGRPVMLVTGASRGIGAAVALAAAGTYDLGIAHTGTRSADAVIEASTAAGASVLELSGDVADEQTVVDWFRRLDERFGRFDVLVNNAGIAGAYGELAVVDQAMLARLFAVNVGGAFLCAREAAARLSVTRSGTRSGMRSGAGPGSAGRGGSIINISSKAAVLGGSGEWVHYAATKGAIDTMTTGLAKELGPQGIRVNTVRPGLIVSDFHDIAPGDRVERMAPTVPMQRAGTAAEVATAVLWLASDEASYVTGAFIDVTGGR